MITYTFKIKANKPLIQKIENHLNITRLVYNLAKETKECAYFKGVKLSKFDLINQLPELKQGFVWLKEVHSQTLQGVLERLDESYQNYFRKLKDGSISKEKVQYITKKLANGGEISESKLKDFGKPKWASKKRWRSVSFKKAAVKYNNNNTIEISKIGKIKFFKSREIYGEIKIVRIIKEVDGYYIQIVTDNEILKSDSQAEVGIDLGLRYFLVTSDGEYIDNPKHLEKYLKQLRVEQRSLARKQKYSNNWYKQTKRIQKLYLKIRRVRKDFLHKTSTALSKNYGIIFCEDLNIAGMVQDRKYSRSISDVAWGGFLELLEQKTNLIRVEPKYTSQRCSNCGHVDKKSRKTQSEFVCTKCGVIENADKNASNNIKQSGQRLLEANVSH